MDEADLDTLPTEIQDSSILPDEINETLIKIEHMLKNVKTAVSASTLLELCRFSQAMSLKNI